MDIFSILFSRRGGLWSGLLFLPLLMQAQTLTGTVTNADTGRPIDHFLVEGMDVTGGRYNQVNNNLDARAVKTAEIMENYQSVQTLRDKLPSEDVALNLRLDPDARDQWLPVVALGLGTDGDRLLHDTRLNALRLGPSRQSIYNYKGNNQGIDFSDEQTVLSTADGRQTVADLPSFLTPPALATPIDKERLLFNDTHTLNANRIRRLDDQRTLRLQADYLHDRNDQRRTNDQLFHADGDTLRLSEDYRYRLRTDQAHLEARYEDNSPDHYLTNRLLAEATSAASDELQTAGFRQQRTDFTVKNLFNWLKTTKSGTWEVVANDELRMKN